jgi:hypothetical protein
LKSQGAPSSPGGSALTPGGRRASTSRQRGQELNHILRLETDVRWHDDAQDRSCRQSLRDWHRFSSQIDRAFRLCMPPCIGIFWLRMMFLAGFTYSYVWLAAFMVLVVLMFTCAWWAQLRAIYRRCGATWCLTSCFEGMASGRARVSTCCRRRCHRRTAVVPTRAV